MIVVTGPGCSRPSPSAFAKTKDKGGGEGNHDRHVYEAWIVIPNCNPSCNQRSLLDTTEIGPPGQVGQVERDSALPVRVI